MWPLRPSLRRPLERCRNEASIAGIGRRRDLARRERFRLRASEGLELSEAPAAPLSLGRLAVRGGVIFGLAGVIDNAAQFIRAILLARILTPADFGLMGMALIVIHAGEALSQTGYEGFVSGEFRPLPDADSAARSAIEHLRGVRRQ